MSTKSINDPCPLDWRVDEWDDNDNSIYAAPSPYGDGCTSFSWRIKQRLVADAIEFYEASDPELMEEEKNPESWPSLEAAKAAMQKWDDEIRASIKPEHLEERP